jgi:hypothetical protein
MIYHSKQSKLFKTEFRYTKQHPIRQKQQSIGGNSPLKHILFQASQLHLRN